MEVACSFWEDDNPYDIFTQNQEGSMDITTGDILCEFPDELPPPKISGSMKARVTVHKSSKCTH